MVASEPLVSAFLIAQRMRVALRKRRLRKLIFRSEEAIEQRRKRGIRRRVELVQRSADDRNAAGEGPRHLVCRHRLRGALWSGPDLAGDFLHGRALLLWRELQKPVINRDRLVADGELRH
ncbi:hypothetical protein ACQR1I_16505 [Bradyrhizobium sp. HKCCYLS2038]|uniref:hypothetical protein n=1 Tax=Bradyrhizobium sp. HKCCYLS2038 TaxID=3420764 RepID=UPI003EB9B466